MSENIPNAAKWIISKCVNWTTHRCLSGSSLGQSGQLFHSYLLPTLTNRTSEADAEKRLFVLAACFLCCVIGQTFVGVANADASLLLGAKIERAGLRNSLRKKPPKTRVLSVLVASVTAFIMDQNAWRRLLAADTTRQQRL